MVEVVKCVMVRLVVFLSRGSFVVVVVEFWDWGIIFIVGDVVFVIRYFVVLVKVKV